MVKVTMEADLLALSPVDSTKKCANFCAMCDFPDDGGPLMINRFCSSSSEVYRCTIDFGVKVSNA